jgi:deoxyribodipyrimidine photo-lyase
LSGEEDEAEDGAGGEVKMEEGEEGAENAPAPSQVHMDRVRLMKPDGSRVPVKAVPWRTAGAAAASSASAAAAASSSASQSGSVVYWMSREQRVQDNWSLLYAQQLAIEHNAQLRVVFCLVPKYLDATERQYHFMLEGMKEIEEELRSLHIPFEILIGYAWESLPSYVEKHQAGAVVTDFGPLRISKEWTKKVSVELNKSSVPLLLIDAHNVVPLWIASEKQEYAARTIRPKIMGKLKEYLTDFPKVKPGKAGRQSEVPKIDWKQLDASLEIDRRVKSVDTFMPGTKAALDVLHSFIRSRLHHFAAKRNDPNAKHLSNLSPYLHFGQIAPQRAAFEVNKYRGVSTRKGADTVKGEEIRGALLNLFCLPLLFSSAFLRFRE